MTNLMNLYALCLPGVKRRLFRFDRFRCSNAVPRVRAVLLFAKTDSDNARLFGVTGEWFEFFKTIRDAGDAGV